MLPFMPELVTWTTSLSLALTVGAVSRVATAAEPVVAAARLDVDANPACASRADLVARVRARSPRIRFTEDGAGLEIRAEFAVTGTGSVAGKVTLASAGTKPSVRRVLGANCNDAADAVALIIAVSLDPTAGSREKGGAASEAPPNGPSREDPRAPASQEAAKAETAGPAAASRAPDHANAEADARSRNSFAVQLAAQALFGPAPKGMAGVALSAMIAIERPSLWSPAVLLGASHSWRTGIEAEGGTAGFTLDAASFDACPFRFGWGPVGVRPCGSVLIGRMSARGSETRNPATESRRPFWVVGGAAVANASLFGPFELGARVAVGANLVRDSFVFTPAVFHEVPAITAAASLGIGARWR
jgi:hypothetical protein